MPSESSPYSHQQIAKIGVLIANLGTPDAPTAKAVRPYLKEFLSDPRIVDLPRWLWWFVLNGIILRIRPSKSAKAYRRVWTERGSPLAFHTEDQATALREKLIATWGDRIVVDWAMCYGNPSIASRLQAMLEQGVEKLLVLPMYPQYSSAATAPIYDAIAKYFKTRMWLPELRIVNSYYEQPQYLDAIVSSVRNHWEKHGKADKLLFSYHGLPLNYLHKGDPYHCQCLKTTRLVAEKLELKESEYQTTFQSRVGVAAWLQPYTDEVLKNLPTQGISSVQVLCPGFSADCLETIDEIAFENKEFFIAAGGQRFEYIPALNASDSHIQALLTIIDENIASWRTESGDRTQTQVLFDNFETNKQLRR